VAAAASKVAPPFINDRRSGVKLLIFGSLPVYWLFDRPITAWNGC
jgi:hypothetical protein